MPESTPLTDFRFKKTTLYNGLDVIIRRQAQLPIVAINLWYHVGSKNEERHQRGFTHLFEHLMFEGSAHYPGDFFKHLQPLGANINGSTSSDRTNYFVDLPTAHAERAIAMESDRMANLFGALDQSKLRVQKDVVKNEYRQNYANRPYGMVGPLIAETLYPPEHPYSWMTIGVMEDLDRATLDDVSAFFRRFYVPSNASLALVGDLDRRSSTGHGGTLFRADRRRLGGTATMGPRARPERHGRDRSPRSRRARSALSRLADRPAFPRRRRGPPAPGRRAGSGEIKPSAPEAGDRRANRPGRDCVSSRDESSMGRSGSLSRCGPRDRSTRLEAWWSQSLPPSRPKA